MGFNSAFKGLKQQMIFDTTRLDLYSSSSGQFQEFFFSVLVYRTFKIAVRGLLCVLDCVACAVGVFSRFMLFGSFVTVSCQQNGFWWRCGWRLSVGFVCRNSYT
jgi:hypothetical protein